MLTPVWVVCSDGQYYCNPVYTNYTDWYVHFNDDDLPECLVVADTQGKAKRAATKLCHLHGINCNVLPIVRPCNRLVPDRQGILRFLFMWSLRLTLITRPPVPTLFTRCTPTEPANSMIIDMTPDVDVKVVNVELKQLGPRTVD